MKYYTKHPVGVFIEITKEAYEASTEASIALGECSSEQSMSKNCPGLLSLDRSSYRGEKATVKDMDGILKTFHYFSNEGISLLKEITAWSESSMLSRMQDRMKELETLVIELQEQVNTLQMEGEVKDFLLKVSRKNWKQKAICRDEDNCLYLDNCIDMGDCKGCNKTFLGKVIDYL